MGDDFASTLMEVMEYSPPQDKTKATFRRRMETYYERFGCWVITIIIFSSPFVFLGLFFVPSFWVLNVAYILWMIYDRETPHRGSRKMKWFGKLRFWRCRSNYFPLKLVKTAELPADTTYLFCCFPHGAVFAISTCIMSDVTHFDEAFPGLDPYLITLGANYYLPLARDFLLIFGGCAASPRGILHILNGPPGNVGVLIVGGRSEQWINMPGTNRIILKNRKGFVRMALKAGSPLVPVYSFGECDVYEEPTSSCYKWLRGKIRAIFDPEFFMYRGPFKLSYFFGMLPYQRPITTVGKPIPVPKVENPASELVEKYHQIFVQELVRLFDTYKVKYDSKGENAILSIE